MYHVQAVGNDNKMNICVPTTQLKKYKISSIFETPVWPTPMTCPFSNPSRGNPYLEFCFHYSLALFCFPWVHLTLNNIVFSFVHFWNLCRWNYRVCNFCNLLLHCWKLHSQDSHNWCIKPEFPIYCIESIIWNAL